VRYRTDLRTCSDTSCTVGRTYRTRRTRFSSPRAAFALRPYQQSAVDQIRAAFLGVALVLSGQETRESIQRRSEPRRSPPRGPMTQATSTQGPPFQPARRSARPARKPTQLLLWISIKPLTKFYQFFSPNSRITKIRWLVNWNKSLNIVSFAAVPKTGSRIQRERNGVLGGSIFTKSFTPNEGPRMQVFEPFFSTKPEARGQGYRPRAIWMAGFTDSC
jgi:hypothetical protein